MLRQPVSIDDVADALECVRARRPLVHNITNYVAMTVSANALLAADAQSHRAPDSRTIPADSPTCASCRFPCQ